VCISVFGLQALKGFEFLGCNYALGGFEFLHRMIQGIQEIASTRLDTTRLTRLA
jgi:hypothetical protein